MKTIIILFIFHIVFFNSFSQDSNKKETLVIDISNQDDLLLHKYDISEKINYFYIKSMSKFSSKAGFKSINPEIQTEDSYMPEAKTFSKIYDSINKDYPRSHEILKYLSNYNLIFLLKEPTNNLYISYEVMPFVMSH